MDALMGIAPGSAGLLVWLLWALIGLFLALLVQRTLGGRRMMWLDITVGVVGSVLGGFLSICWLDQSSIQLFLMSILSAVFFSGIALWIAGTLLIHFTKK